SVRVRVRDRAEPDWAERGWLAAGRRGLEPWEWPGMSAEPHGSACGLGAARAQAAGPVLGGHPALARRLDVTEADRAGTRADQDGAPTDLELAGRDVRQVPGRQ